MFLISSVKAPEKAQTMVFKELQHEDPHQRINAVLRYCTWILSTYTSKVKIRLPIAESVN